ncbi:MAG: DUF4167 domain-containing protein [Proteobacteria bacterium]|nr:DUF4167 domain-containing protein [Pseudomonadota bacterium]
MRDFKGMKRQRGRNRPGGGGGGGGGKPGNANRAFDSQGPENLKVRGSAQHIFEKYQQLARDATGAGDRVLLENYLQHAEHYYRLIRTLQPQRTPAEIMGRDQVANGYDLDFEDEAIEAMQNAANEAGAVQADNEAAAEERGETLPPRDGPNRDGQLRDGQNREGQNREGQPREFRDRGEFRRDREGREFREGPRDGPREGRPDGPREARGDREFRDRGEFRRDRDRDRPDRDRPRDGQGGGDGRTESRYGERPRFGERPREEGGEQPGPSAAEPELPGIERPAAPSGDGGMLRDEEGGMSPAPAFLQAAAPAADGEPRAPRPRRRRTRAAAEAADGGDSTPAPTSEGDEG